MSHKYFTINERNKLEVCNVSEILDRHRATIYLEIKGIKGEYSYKKAQMDADSKVNKATSSRHS